MRRESANQFHRIGPNSAHGVGGHQYPLRYVSPGKHKSALINPIQGLCDADQAFNLTIVLFPIRHPHGPINRRLPAPTLLRMREQLPFCPLKSFRRKLVKRTVNIVESRSSASAVKSSRNNCVAPRREFPRTTDLHRCAIRQIDSRGCKIFDGTLVRLVFSLSAIGGEGWGEGDTSRKQSAAHVNNFWPPKTPQGQIHQMDAQINNAAAARKFVVIEPWLVRAVSVVKNQFSRV